MVVLSDIWGEKNLSLERGSYSYIEKQSTSDNVTNDVLAVDKTDSVHAKMIEFEPLLEASGERNPRSIKLTHGNCACQCVAQTVMDRRREIFT